MKTATLRALASARAARQPVVVVTRLRDGAQSLVQAGHPQGDLELVEPVLAEVRERGLHDRSGRLQTDPGLFMRCYTPARRLILVGAVHIAQALAPAAVMAGFDVTIVDPRTAFATVERFPATRLAHDWPDVALAKLAPDAQTAVVALSHDPKLDDPALIAALASPAFYVGALGSRRTHAARLERFAARGITGTERLRAPVGLDLGGRSAGEIAIAIIAEIIQTRYRPIERIPHPHHPTPGDSA
jgi:xanthine dehydrogenase accessory factor